MRADSCLSHTISTFRLLVLVLLALAAAGCKTEKSPDQPTLLGEPPTTAYLGVKYYYNWGAYGGEDILDYTLTNAPSWLALEDTSNKARQGIIMAGVPGLTGGGRGDADLGNARNINLVTTDGGMSGVQPFDIEVKYNALALETATFTEGSASEEPADTRFSHCAAPDLSQAGTHEFTINTYNDDGSVSGEKTVKFPTKPVYVKLTLDKPSVTRVQVAFELGSEYDPNKCDPSYQGPTPHQRCDFSAANASDAIVGKDIVGRGSDSPAPVDVNGDPLDYLSYEKDDDGFFTRGVVTLEPGIQECYIRLEVVDDSFAELSEAARLTLTEVRSGLAGLGENNDGVRTNLAIDDNEPVVSLMTKAGGARDTINVGTSREYVAKLTGVHDEKIHARLTHSEDSTARLGSEFEIEQVQNGVWVSDPELVFPKDVNQLLFRVTVPPNGGIYSNPDLPDRFVELAVDEQYQAGRENFARPESDSLLRISLNELTAPLPLGTDTSFVPTDIAMGHNGRLFVAGYDTLDSNRVKVRIYDQKGNLLQDVGVTPAVDSITTTAITDAPPVISAVRREVSEGNVKVSRYEFVVAYGTSGPIDGTTEQGGEDVITSVFWFDEASNGGEYVPKWTARTGTSGNDRVRGAGINGDSGYVILSGETNGVWPDERSAGGYDSFLQRIDTVVDGSNEVPKVAWTRQVGSVSNDSVAGSAVAGITPVTFGSAIGSVGGAPVIGGEDAFFYSAGSTSTTPVVQQVGTDGDEKVTDGLLLGSTLWLLGNSDGRYFTKTDAADVTTLGRETLNSQAGFLLSYNTSGDFQDAHTINDPGDIANETFKSLIEFDGDLVAGGRTDSGAQAILSRVSLADPDADPPEFQNSWLYPFNFNDSDFPALANYRDDEIVALARLGTTWSVVLYSPEGVLLTSP